MRKLEVRFTRAPEDSPRVGMLAEERGRVYFEYDAAFLASGLNLSPFKIPFEVGLFEHRELGFGPLPGLFDDSLPDGWGLLLMDRHFRSQGRDPSALSALDRLAWLGERTMGALTYHPPAAAPEPGGDFHLQALARHAQEVLAGDAAELLPELLRAGGTPGGARPKVLVGFAPGSGRMLSGADDLPAGFEHWIVKFFAKDAPADTGAVERAYALMAGAAGVDMPPTRLFRTKDGGRFFGARRFDREGNRRRHVHTFGNLIHSDFRVPSADYGDLLKAVTLLTRDHAESLRAFRRMAFNWIARNRDDHVKNFSFLLDDDARAWRLAPAYDLSFAAGPAGEHAMTLAGEGREPGLAHALLVADRAGIARRDALVVIDAVRAAVARWREFAAAAGVSAPEARRIAGLLPKLPPLARGAGPRLRRPAPRRRRRR